MTTNSAWLGLPQARPELAGESNNQVKKNHKFSSPISLGGPVNSSPSQGARNSQS